MAKDPIAGPCPSDATLTGLAEGQLDGGALAAAEAHIDRCAACQATLRLFGVISQVEERGPQPPDAGASVAVPARYQLRGRLGRGSQAVVWSARDNRLDRDVALKVVSLADPQSRSRFTREGQAVAALDHANVVQVYDVHTAGAHGMLAMERCRHALDTETLPWPAAVAAFRSIANGLVAVHEAGMVHRDIKPSNLFVSADGTAKIGDFGLVGDDAAAVSTCNAAGGCPGSGDKLETGLVGTPAFMAPELFAGEACTPATDQYAFFASLAAVVTGAPSAVPIQWPAGSAPHWLQRVVARGLRADPARRYPSMAAAGAALRGPGWRGRRWIPAAAVVVVVVGVAAGLARPPSAPDCADTKIFTWTDVDREALARVVAPAEPGNPEAVATLNDGLTRYAGETATLASELCRAQPPTDRGNPGRQCLDIHAERVRAFAQRLTGSPLGRNGGNAALRIMPEVLSFEHCERTRVSWTPPDPRRPALAAAIHGAWAERLLGSVGEGSALLEQALQRPELAAFPDLHASALVRRAFHALGGPSPRAAEDDLEAAAPLAAEGADPTVEVNLWVQRSTQAFGLMRYDEAKRELSFARAALARAGRPRTESIKVELLEVAVAWADGDWDRALKRVDVAKSAATDFGHPELIIEALQYEATIFSGLGRYDESMDAVARARAVAIDAGYGPGDSLRSDLDLATGTQLVLVGRIEEAVEVFERLVAMSESRTVNRVEYLQWLSRSYLYTGRLDEALEVCTSAQQLLRQLRPDKATIRRAVLEQLHAHILMTRGDQQSAVAIMQRVAVELDTELGYEHSVTRWARAHLEEWQTAPRCGVDAGH